MVSNIEELVFELNKMVSGNELEIKIYKLKPDTDDYNYLITINGIDDITKIDYLIGHFRLDRVKETLNTDYSTYKEDSRMLMFTVNDFTDDRKKELMNRIITALNIGGQIVIESKILI